ncbi:MAG: membrane protein insertase YidC, partial [Thioalkalispiraceae bacterium]
MEQQRIFLILLLGMITVMLYFEWQKDYGPQAPETTISQDGTTTSSDLPPGSAEQEATDTPMPVPQSQTGSPASSEPQPVQPTTASKGKLIEVETDVFKILIDTQGGRIEQVD